MTLMFNHVTLNQVTSRFKLLETKGTYYGKSTHASHVKPPAEHCTCRCDQSISLNKKSENLMHI